MLENNLINNESIRIEPYVLIDELSGDEIYVGTSISFNDKGSNVWKIKRIIKLGTVWHIQFPNGNRDFIFSWDNRLTYTYN